MGAYQFLFSSSCILQLVCACHNSISLLCLDLQLRLPIQPPLAVLANKLADGMLGLRWAKVKVGSGSNAVVMTVQASHVLSKLLPKVQPAYGRKPCFSADNTEMNILTTKTYKESASKTVLTAKPEEMVWYLHTPDGCSSVV